jgi:hypothetical protein
MRLVSSLMVSVAAGLLFAGTAHAAAVQEDDLAGLETVADAELAGQRGGFLWNGVSVSLGAHIRTYMNGELALETVVSWTPAGNSVTQTASPALTPATAAQVQAGVLTSGGITARVGDDTVFLANGGQTALLHRTDGGIQNVLINTASHVDITQQVDATLDLAGYDTFASDVGISRLGIGLGDAAGAATAGSLGF